MASSKYPNDSKRESSSVVAQLAYDNIQKQIMSALLTDPVVRQLEASIDPVEFLQALRLSHGLTPSRYSFTKGEHGPLFIVGNSNYRPVEFLKNVMHFSAEESGRIIRGEQTSMDLISHVSPYELKLRSSKWESEDWYVSVDSPEEAHAVMRFLNAVEKDRGEDFNLVFLRVIKVPYPLHIGTRAQSRGRIRSYAIIKAPIEAMRELSHYDYPVAGNEGRVVRSRDVHSENTSHDGDWKWATFTSDIIENGMDWATKNLTPQANGKYWTSWTDIP